MSEFLYVDLHVSICCRTRHIDWDIPFCKHQWRVFYTWTQKQFSLQMFCTRFLFYTFKPSFVMYKTPPKILRSNDCTDFSISPWKNWPASRYRPSIEIFVNLPLSTSIFRCDTSIDSDNKNTLCTDLCKTRNFSSVAIWATKLDEEYFSERHKKRETYVEFTHIFVSLSFPNRSTMPHKYWGKWYYFSEFKKQV